MGQVDLWLWSDPGSVSPGFSVDQNLNITQFLTFGLSTRSMCYRSQLYDLMSTVCMILYRQGTMYYCIFNSCLVYITVAHTTEPTRGPLPLHKAHSHCSKNHSYIGPSFAISLEWIRNTPTNPAPHALKINKPEGHLGQRVTRQKCAFQSNQSHPEKARAVHSPHRPDRSHHRPPPPWTKAGTDLEWRLVSSQLPAPRSSARLDP